MAGAVEIAVQGMGTAADGGGHVASPVALQDQATHTGAAGVEESGGDSDSVGAVAGSAEGKLKGVEAVAGADAVSAEGAGEGARTGEAAGGTDEIKGMGTGAGESVGEDPGTGTVAGGPGESVGGVEGTVERVREVAGGVEGVGEVAGWAEVAGKGANDALGVSAGGIEVEEGGGDVAGVIEDAGKVAGQSAGKVTGKGSVSMYVPPVSQEALKAEGKNISVSQGEQGGQILDKGVVADSEPSWNVQRHQQPSDLALDLNRGKGVAGPIVGRWFEQVVHRELSLP